MTGPDCDLPSCPENCSGHGLCMNGSCVCWSGFVGDRCAVPTGCAETCLTVCKKPSESCTKCLGQCETLLDSPQLGIHSPFMDYATT